MTAPRFLNSGRRGSMLFPFFTPTSPLLSSSVRSLTFGSQLKLLSFYTSSSSSSSTITSSSPSKQPTSQSQNKLIGIDTFSKVDIRVVKIVSAEHVEGAHKLLKIKVDLGAPSSSSSSSSPLVPSFLQEGIGGEGEGEGDRFRTVFSGIKAFYKPEVLIGKNVLYLANLEPRKMKFGVSQGMILAASTDDGKTGVFLTTTDEGATPGMKVT